MKRTIITLLFTLFAVLAIAQRTPHALGFHIGGSTVDLEYQYHFNTKNFVDATVGVFDFDDGFLAQGVYNWNIQRWSHWTPHFGTWKLWGGIGAGVGFFDDDEDNQVMLGPVGTLGFGCTLRNCPLSFGVDYRPMVAFILGGDTDIEDRGFRNIGFTLTYRF